MTSNKEALLDQLNELRYLARTYHIPFMIDYLIARVKQNMVINELFKLNFDNFEKNGYIKLITTRKPGMLYISLDMHFASSETVTKILQKGNKEANTKKAVM